MESVGSNQTPTLRRHTGQPFAERVVRALHHRLFLLHRADPATFFVLGATGNVYSVTLSPSPTCTCPDRAATCKHILFVLIRALGVSPNDPSLRRRYLRPCHLARLLASPVLPGSLAGASLRRRFLQLASRPPEPEPEPAEFEEGSSCPVCLEEMGKGEKVVACGACRNRIHEECLTRWKRSGGRRAVTCVLCRARWRDRVGQRSASAAERYLNLAAYVDEAEHGDDDGDTSDDNRGEDLCGGS